MPGQTAPGSVHAGVWCASSTEAGGDTWPPHPALHAHLPAGRAPAWILPPASADEEAQLGRAGQGNGGAPALNGHSQDDLHVGGRPHGGEGGNSNTCTFRCWQNRRMHHVAGSSDAQPDLEQDIHAAHPHCRLGSLHRSLGGQLLCQGGGLDGGEVGAVLPIRAGSRCCWPQLLLPC
jgi:hypothetical protein